MTDQQPSQSLKKKSVRAALWSGADMFMRQGVQFVVAIILARLLSPEEFGTIALLYLFSGIASVFIDSGFSSALVQRQQTTHLDESTVFWINLAMGTLAATALWLSAPWIAAFFGHQVLVPLTGVLAASLLLNALGSIHMVLFSKRLEFKKPMIINAVATAASGMVAVFMAFEGFGVWALAIQTIVGSLVTTTLLWLMSPWRPSLKFSGHSARSLFRFGSYLMLSGLLDIAYNRIYSLLIGKFYGVRDLAFYNRADNTKQIPVDLLSMTLSRVAFPVLSAAAHDKAKLRRGVQLAVRVMMMINVPTMFGLMATADNVILVLFGEQWRSAAPILQVLCIAGIFWPLHVINLSVLKAQGRSDLFFRLELIKKFVGATLLVAGTFYGVMGIAWSQAAFSLVAFLINAHYTRTDLGYGARNQFLDFLPIGLISIAMACIVYFIGQALSVTNSAVLLAQVACGAVFVVLMSAMVGIKAYRDSISFLSSG